MKTVRTLAICAGALLWLAANAQAVQEHLQGRSGLPTVRKGGGAVWMERGSVVLRYGHGALEITQNYRLHYPGPPLERGAQTIQVAVREDYFRALNGGPEVTEGEAKGFTTFQVRADGRKVQATAEPWELNEKKNTATRWRVWNMTFKPGQVRSLRITSRAPLGRRGSRPYFMFITKDLGGWRSNPDVIEIRFTAPGSLETRLDGAEPKPADINSRAVRWVFRKKHPARDIFVLLPPAR
jgi:hypothetical protein